MPLVSLHDNDYTLDVADFEESYPKYQPTTPQPSKLTQNALLPTNIDSTGAVEDVSVVTCDTLLKNSHLSSQSGNSSNHDIARGSLHQSTEGNFKNTLKLSTMTYSDKGVAPSTYYSRQWSLTSNQSQGIRQSFIENNNNNSSYNSNNFQSDCNRSRGESSENTSSRSNPKEQEREDGVENEIEDHQEDEDNETLNHLKCRHDSSTTATNTSVSTLPVNNNSTSTLSNTSKNGIRRNSSYSQDYPSQKPLASDGIRRNTSFATTGDTKVTTQNNKNIKNTKKKKGSKVDLANFFTNINHNDEASAVSKGNVPFSAEPNQISGSTDANENDYSGYNNEYVRQLEEKLTKLSLDLATCRSQLDVQRLRHHQSLINSEEQIKEKDFTIKNLQEKLYMMQQMHQTRSSTVVDPYHKAAHVKAAASQQRMQLRNQHTSSVVDNNSSCTFSRSDSYSSNVSSDIHDINSCQDGALTSWKNKEKQEESRRSSWISIRLGPKHFNDSHKSIELKTNESTNIESVDSQDIYGDDDDNDDPFATYSESRRASSSMASNYVMANGNTKKQRNWLERSLPWGNHEKIEKSKKR